MVYQIHSCGPQCPRHKQQPMQNQTQRRLNIGRSLRRSLVFLGGAGSGNFGHAGRPGEVGGSASGGSFIEDYSVVASELEPPHEVRDVSKFDALISSMKKDGWKGDPVLVVKSGELLAAITGSHRIAAARQAGVDVPVIELDSDKLQEWLDKDFERNSDLFFDRFGLPRVDDTGSMEEMLKKIGDKEALSLYRQESGVRSNQLTSNATTRIHGLASRQKAVLRRDPTRTTLLRARFAREMRLRFQRIKRLIIESVEVNDCFGLNEPMHSISILGGAGSGNFGHAGRPGEVGGSGEGGSLYHGTSVQIGKKIKKEGLKMAYAKTSSSYNKLIWTTRSLESAQAYGRGEGRTEYAIVTLKPEAASLGSDDISVVTFRKDVPSSMIESVKIFRSAGEDRLTAEDIQILMAGKLYAILIPEGEGKWSLYQPTKKITSNAAVPVRAFQFKTSKAKVQGFMDWLSKEVDNGVLQVIQGPRRRKVASQAWTDTYITSAYKKGMDKAGRELQRAHKALPRYRTPEGQATIEASFNSPFHADRVGLLYTRVFTELKGITDAMEKTIARTLAQGMAEGRGPREIARILARRVDAKGFDLSIEGSMGREIDATRRAEMLARTEIIRSHAEAALNMYDEAGLEGVSLEAEWITAGFNVCPECEEQAGESYTIDEARGLIPLHPNCRCTWIPKLVA